MTILCCRPGASDNALIRALDSAKQEAKRRERIVYLYEESGYVMMAETLPEGYKWIARCYPGGRTEIGGRLAEIKIERLEGGEG